MKRLKEYLTDFPTTAFFALLAGVLFLGTGIGIAITIGVAQWRSVALDGSYQSFTMNWLDKVLILAGVSGSMLIGKRATAKAEVVDAETRQAVATGSVPPPSPPSPSSTNANAALSPQPNAVVAALKDRYEVPTPAPLENGVDETAADRHALSIGASHPDD